MHRLVRPARRAGWIQLVGLSVAIGMVAAAAWYFFDAGRLLRLLLSSQLSAEEKIDQLRLLFASFGVAAPAVYVLVVILEVVVAPIPGTLLYAPGGAIFGGFWGGLLTLAGNVLGAVIACVLARRFRLWLSPRFLEQSAMVALQSRIARHGLLLVFLLRVNPFTSSDLISYAAGLTPMPLWKLACGTAVGMAPLCWGQSYAAQQLLAAFPNLIYPLGILGFVYVAVVFAVMLRVLRSPAATADTLPNKCV